MASATDTTESTQASSRSQLSSDRGPPAPLNKSEEAGAGKARLSLGMKEPVQQQLAPVPGYCGYVPELGPRNDVGKSNAGVIERATEHPGGAASVVNSLPTWNAAPRGLRSNSPVRAGMQIPGYSGHVPLVGPRNFLGATFCKANQRAHGPERQSSLPRWPCETEPVVPPTRSLSPRRQEDSRRLSCSADAGTDASAGARQSSSRERSTRRRSIPRPPHRLHSHAIPRADAAPGYCGHVPGKEEVFGLKQSAANKVGLSKDGEFTSPRPGRHESRDRSSSTRLPRVSLSPNGAIPGYMGHVPRRTNTFGETFAKATEKASRMAPAAVQQRSSSADAGNPAASKIGERISSRASFPTGDVPRACVAAPGYSGFVPGKYTENVCGKTFQAANSHAAAVSPAVRVARSFSAKLLSTESACHRGSVGRQRSASSKCRDASEHRRGSQTPERQPGGRDSLPPAGQRRDAIFIQNGHFVN